MSEGIEQNDITAPKKPRRAPGRPGCKPHWSSGAKDAVGSAIPAASRVWFTIGTGTLNELYFPDADTANTRSVRFLLTGPEGYFSDEQLHADHTVTPLEPGVPAYRIHSASNDGCYTLTKLVFTDPGRDTLLYNVKLDHAAPELRLFVFLEPQLLDMGNGNTAHIGEYKGWTMLFGHRRDAALACACSSPFLQTTCGFTGKSDGYIDLQQHGEITRSYNFAENGNIGLLAELDLKAAASENGLTLALGFGGNCAEAAQQAAAGLLENNATVLDLYLAQWREEQAKYLDLPDLGGAPLDLYRTSTAVLQTHRSKRYPGAFVASLSIPWGFARSDTDTAGYHVLWPRDLVETAFAKLASGDSRSARDALFYLAGVQEADGHWAQNLWLDGTPDLRAVQLDSTALPILLACRLHNDKIPLDFKPWPTVKRAAGYLVRRGPCTGEDRWEEIPGYSVFTMSLGVAALLAAADLADVHSERETATLLRETADAWNDAIDEYTYASDTPLAHKYNVPGYYLRLAPPAAAEDKSLKRLQLALANKPFRSRYHRAVNVVSPDALQLVRMGLRSAEDPRIQATVRVLDGELRHELSTGAGWIRGSFDGYGERADGSPYKKYGIGRCWPLLAGERGHFELAAGRRDAALELLRTMARQTSRAGMLPEQVWDAPDIPSRFLFNGHPTGSGMPLAWAHAEYISLLRSLRDGHVWDMPSNTIERYIQSSHPSPITLWSAHERRAWLRRGQKLRLMLEYPAEVRWSTPGNPEQDLNTAHAPFDLHIADLPTAELPSNETITVHITPTLPDKENKPFTIKLRVR